MFTGIITEIGITKRFAKSGGVYRLDLSCRDTARGAKPGDSIAVNGVCLTAVDISGDAISFDIMNETVRRSSLAALKAGSRVNVESALKMGDHLGGHIVQGHVDCVGRISRIEDRPGEVSMEIVIDKKDSNLIVGKGSVTIDGVGLTVGEAGDGVFKVYLIPHTRKVTTLGERKAGDMVNVEFDIVGKYILRSRELEKKGSGVSEELLRRANFI